MIKRVALFAAVVLTAGHLTAQAQDAQSVFKRIQDKYDTVESLRAEFKQTMTSAYSEDAAVSSGVLILQGDKYRVETTAQTLVANGQETYVYLPGEQQLLINDVVEDETAFSPSEFLLHYDDRYNVTSVETVQYQGQPQFKLTLEPKKDDAFFKQATLLVRTSDAIITQLDVLDVNETRMVFDLTNIELNPSLDDSTFTFKAPEGVEVIDLRS